MNVNKNISSLEITWKESSKRILGWIQQGRILLKRFSSWKKIIWCEAESHISAELFQTLSGVCHDGYVNSNFSKNDVEQEKLILKCKPFQNRKHDLEFK